MVEAIARFLQERKTKRTVRFYEVDNGTGEQLCDTLYVKQSMLTKLGYREGDTLEVAFRVKREQ